MKKSQEDTDAEEAIEKAEGLGDLSAEEVELVKAWRAQKEENEEEISKSQKEDSEKVETLQKALKEENDTLKKALTEQGDMIKSLNDKIEKLASQPAYDKRSLDRLEPVEKSANANVDLTKSQIVERMLEMQMAGKGVTSRHIAEFEATGNVSDKAVKQMVMNSFKN